MNSTETPYSITNPVTVLGPDDYYYTFFLKRNIVRAGELDDLFGPSIYPYQEYAIWSHADLPCYFKKWKNVYNYSGSGYYSTSRVPRPLFGFLVYKKHTLKDSRFSYHAGGNHQYFNPLYYVPRVVNYDFEQKEYSFEPMYETINPTITRIEGTNTALMTFWVNGIYGAYKSNWETGGNIYLENNLDFSKVGYYDPWNDTIRNIYNGKILSSGESSSFCCGAVIEWKEVSQFTTGMKKSENKVLTPLVTRVYVIQTMLHPTIDISGGGAGSSNYDGPFKLSFDYEEESSSVSSSETTLKSIISCSGGYCQVNGTARNVPVLKIDIPSQSSNYTREIILHYHQELNDSGSIASYNFELILSTTMHYSCGAKDSYYHLGRLSNGSSLLQYHQGTPRLFTFQTGC